MTDDREREDLEDLVASAGWHRFVSHVTQDLEAGYLDAVSRVVGEADSDADALRTIKQMAGTRDHLRKMLSWPKERLRLVRPAVEKGRSRRGGL